METDPQTISAYLIYLSQHAPVEEQAAHNDLVLVNSASDAGFEHPFCFSHSSPDGFSIVFMFPCRTSPG